jgi:hypothetical protein
MENVSVEMKDRNPEQNGVAGHVGDEGMGNPEVAPAVG